MNKPTKLGIPKHLDKTDDKLILDRPEPYKNKRADLKVCSTKGA